MSMPPGMPLPALLVPDCTSEKAHRAAYERAKADNSIFVCITRQGAHWNVVLDVISRPLVTDEAAKILRSAVEELVATGAAAGGADYSTEYISMHQVGSEGRAREIAAAFHAAIYGLQQLQITVPLPRQSA
ncbi:hypothetical protein [Streptomyces fulvorobeus]|uniref:Uncharacterized protein n=1 Tax=Streptomyces fulvorobeus TaxID=284028 RepID=A0A7J0C8M2_9ACTN|nr:hypothetical protein [Streptomyces fulvorobeus]NYE42394.1 hypothetical protein [Streptomyces fulvorobeus]GFM98792.1 hypothetical protein Sfulv_36030 [Streptomyces fulvorobeus]